MSKPLPPEEKLRERVYDLLHKFADVLQLIEAKRIASGCECMVSDMKGPVYFLQDSVEDLIMFLLDFGAYLDERDDDDDEKPATRPTAMSPADANVAKLHWKLDKMIECDADGSGKWAEEAINAFYEAYRKDVAGSQRLKKVRAIS